MRNDFNAQAAGVVTMDENGEVVFGYTPLLGGIEINRIK